MISRARKLQLIIAGGSIDAALAEFRGNGLAKRREGNREEVLAFLFCFCSPFWPPEARAHNQLIPIAGALAVGHPAALLRHSADLNSAVRAMKDMTRAKEEMDRKIAEWSAELEDLKTFYEAHISLEAPAKYWDQRRRVSTNIAFGAAAAFLTVLICAGIAAVFFAAGVLDFVQSHSPALTVVNGILVVVAPLIAIGWVLRHISRVLIQSINNANGGVSEGASSDIPLDRPAVEGWNGRARSGIDLERAFPAATRRPA